MVCYDWMPLSAFVIICRHQQLSPTRKLANHVAKKSRRRTTGGTWEANTKKKESLLFPRNALIAMGWRGPPILLGTNLFASKDQQLMEQGHKSLKILTRSAEYARRGSQRHIIAGTSGCARKRRRKKQGGNKASALEKTKKSSSDSTKLLLNAQGPCSDSKPQQICWLISNYNISYVKQST